MEPLQHQRRAAGEQVDHSRRVDQVDHRPRADTGAVGVLRGVERPPVAHHARERKAEAGCRDQRVDVADGQQVVERALTGVVDPRRARPRGLDERIDVADASRQW
jgi:hypothetical protein